MYLRLASSFLRSLGWLWSPPSLLPPTAQAQGLQACITTLGGGHSISEGRTPLGLIIPPKAPFLTTILDSNTGIWGRHILRNHGTVHLLNTSPCATHEPLGGASPSLSCTSPQALGSFPLYCPFLSSAHSIQGWAEQTASLLCWYKILDKRNCRKEGFTSLTDRVPSPIAAGAWVVVVTLHLQPGGREQWIMVHCRVSSFWRSGTPYLWNGIAQS